MPASAAAILLSRRGTVPCAGRLIPPFDCFCGKNAGIPVQRVLLLPLASRRRERLESHAHTRLRASVATRVTSGNTSASQQTFCSHDQSKSIAMDAQLLVGSSRALSLSLSLEHTMDPVDLPDLYQSPKAASV